MRRRETLEAWYEGGVDSCLSQEVARRPKLLAVVEHPYMCSNWSAEERLSAIETHYRMIGAERSILRYSPHERVQLLDSDQAPPGIQLALEKPPWLMWEGEVVISLFEETMRRYSLAFSLGMIDGEIVAYVGALQGIGAPNMIDVYRALSHALHGMRPRNFLFAAFRLLCRQLGVQRILATSEHASLHRSPYFKRKLKMTAGDYDAIWTELGGVLLESGFFEIGVPVVYRQPAEIPTRKRAQYRRRYEMLDRIGAQMQRVCSSSTGDPGNRGRATSVPPVG